MNESILVVADNQIYRAIGNISRKILHESDSATSVIEHAIDQFQGNGGQVLLENGDFTLDRPIQLTNNITLRGVGRGTRLIANHYAGLVCEGINGVSIADMRIVAGPNRNAKTGIILDYCGNCSVRDLICIGFADYGILMKNHCFLCEIRGCSLAGNGKANVALHNNKCFVAERDQGSGSVSTSTWQFTRAGFCVPNLVSNCTIFGGGKGIELNETTVANIVACTVYQTHDIAFHIHKTSNSVLISGCRTFQITGPAVVVEESHEFNLSSNIFCWHTEHGIITNNARWGTIVGNEIIDTGSWNSELSVVNGTSSELLPEDFEPFNGINMIDTHGYAVTGNSIFNWQVCPPMKYGIYEDKASKKNVITGNNINLFSEDSVLSLGEETVDKDNVGESSTTHFWAASLENQLQSFVTQLMSEQIELMKS